MASDAGPDLNGLPSPASSTSPLDLQKIASLPAEQQDLYVLSYLSDLEKLVLSFDADGATSHQFFVKKELVKVINLTQPAPTKATRDICGTCFAEIFGKGDRKLLYESINDMISIVSSSPSKSDKDFKAKHAAAHCLGEIFRTAGDSAVSLSNVACSSLLKLLKLAQNHAGVRGTVFRSLGKIFRMLGNSVDESVARDVWKQARNTASQDKSWLAQASALQCLEEMVKSTKYFENSYDLEKLKSTVFKTWEITGASGRRAVASCYSAALVNAYATDDVVAAMKSNKRNSKKIKRQSTMPTEDDGDRAPGTPTAAPAPKKANSKVNLTLEELLGILSATYVKTTTSSKVRAGIIACYAQVFTKLGPTVVETSYGVIINHLLNDVLSHPTISQNRYRLLVTRKWIRILLEDVIKRQLLGESGQINAIKFIANEILKNYPAVLKERPEPSKYALTAALSSLISLIQALGANIASVQDLIRDGLLQILQHPSYSVQVSASWCMKVFVLAAPSQLLPVITICTNNVNRELGLLANRRPTHESFRKCVGFANGLAALISCGSMEPLYASIDVTSRVLNLATSLLKSSGDYDLRISSTQIQVAWILIGGLMSLGPNFVKVHLSQLLLLWKNALPKPLAKDSVLDRSVFELSFLAHVRECALGSILAFLEFNQRLVTTDVAKRLAAMLQNSTLFLNSLPSSKRHSEDSSQKLSPSLTLVDLDLMVRRRILQCYVKLVKLSQGEALQPNLLTIAASFFADPEKYTPSSLSTLIQSAGGGFEGLWDVTDGYSYGVCSLVKGLDIESFAWEAKGMGRGREPATIHWTSQQSAAEQIDRMLSQPIIGAIEHDSVTLYTQPPTSIPQPAPPATEVVNAAIDLFSILLPAQPPKVQESMLEQITNFIAASSLQKDPGRKAALTVNVSVALLGTLKYVQTESRQAQVSWKQSNVLKIIQDLLQQFVISPDAYVRNVAYEAMGRLCSIGGNIFTGSQIKFLIDKIVADIDPNVRAGCAAALGCIHENVGGMAASLHMKTILGILLSLSNDPHPIVHFWALEGLARTIDSAGLNFSGYVNSTLGMMAQLFSADTHDEEVAAIITGNMESDLNTTAVIVKCCNALVGVLGPDLMHMTKLRDMILNLLGQFLASSRPIVLKEALKCMEHVGLFASGSIDMKFYLSNLRLYLTVSSEPDLQRAAVDGLYQVMKSDAEKIIELAEPGLEDQIWEALDDDPSHDGMRNIIKNWLAQITVDNAGAWVKRCQVVMTKLRDRRGRLNAAEQGGTSGGGGGGGGSGGVDLQDEEVASFAAPQEEGSGSAPAPGSGLEQMRWQVRTFAMECLEEVLGLVGKKGEVGNRAIMEQVAEIIRMAFSASTASVVALRLKGLRVIDKVLKMFGKTPDPDFPEAMLLEQYQAQISSALTPAFAVDSSPELAAEAVSVCAAFISTGVVKDVDRMGRILRLLTSTLENFASDTENASIGDLKGLSSNAQVMVKMSVLGAWAELQVASLEQEYLVDVVKPHINTLAPMWLESLREFARLRFEPDISTNTTSAPTMGGSVDMVYSSLNRDVLLKFYQDSWLGLVDAIASLIEQDSQFVFDALDGKSTSNENGEIVKHDISYRDEPVAFFFVLFGIAFEALVGRPGGSDSLATKEQILEVLLALKKILHPSVCGQAVYQEAIFSETVDLLDRLVLTEGIATQLAVVEIARDLCVTHPSARSSSDDNLSEDINQLFELTRLIVLVLAGQLPNLTDVEKPMRGALNEDAVTLIKTALDTLVDAAEVFPSVIKTDLYASILHIFATIFGTGVCQADVVPRSLPIFKRFLHTVTKARGASQDHSLIIQLRGCLARVLAVMENARRLDTESSLHCVRNCLMASTIILTAGVNIIPPEDPQLSQLCDEFVTSTEDPITLRTALQCCRTLLLLPTKNQSDMAVASKLLPRIVSFVAAYDAKDVDDAKGALCQLMIAYLRTLRGEQVNIAMSVFVPALLSRCSHASRHDDARVTQKVYRDTAARLTDMVSQDAQTFKSVMMALSPEQRSFMEEVLRAGAGPVDDGSNKAESAPTIALKMTF